MVLHPARAAAGRYGCRSLHISGGRDPRRGKRTVTREEKFERMLEEALALLNDWEDTGSKEPDGYAARRAALQAGYDAERRTL